MKTFLLTLHVRLRRVRPAHLSNLLLVLGQTTFGHELHKEAPTRAASPPAGRSPAVLHQSSASLSRASRMGHSLVGPRPLHWLVTRTRASFIRCKDTIFASMSATLAAARCLTSAQVVSGSSRRASSSAISLSEKP